MQSDLDKKNAPYKCAICLSDFSTRGAFEKKLAQSSRGTDFRISPTMCTMYNVMVDAKDQSAKLCAMEMGQEVPSTPSHSSLLEDDLATFSHSQDSVAYCTCCCFSFLNIQYIFFIEHFFYCNFFYPVPIA